MAEYFPHDFYARTDPKMAQIYLRAGWEGRAVFWDLVEMLYENGGKLSLAEKESYAYALRTSAKVIEDIVSIAFQSDDEYFWSESVLRRIELREEKSTKAKASAQRRWGVNNANAMRTHNTVVSDSNAIKENKIKENKRESKYSSLTYLKELPVEDVKEFTLTFQASETAIRQKAEQLANYCEGHGKTYKNYRAMLLIALGKDFKPRIKTATVVEELPEISEEQRVANLQKIAEMKSNLLGGLK